MALYKFTVGLPTNYRSANESAITNGNATTVWVRKG